VVEEVPEYGREFRVRAVQEITRFLEGADVSNIEFEGPK